MYRNLPVLYSLRGGVVVEVSYIKSIELQGLFLSCGISHSHDFGEILRVKVEYKNLYCLDY